MSMETIEWIASRSEIRYYFIQTIGGTCNWDLVFMTDDAKQSVKLIKKYKNRRLYDMAMSQYITIEDLQNYVLTDIDFQVIDASSGKDLTSATLLQIFVELEAHSTQSLSPNILRQLIKISQHPLSQHYKTMLEKMLTSLGSQTNPLFSGVPQTAELWTKRSEQLMNTWQKWFKIRS